MKRNLLNHEDFKFLRKVRNKIFVFLISIVIGSPGFSQQISASLLCSGGETFITTNQSLDFAIGEITTESFTGNNLILSQGFIQGLEPTIGVDEKTIDKNDIVVYPNPSVSRIYLFCNTEINPTKVNIRDMQGKTVLSRDFNTSPMSINLNQLQPGFYTITILLENQQTINKKIIKQ